MVLTGARPAYVPSSPKEIQMAGVKGTPKLKPKPKLRPKPPTERLEGQLQDGRDTEQKANLKMTRVKATQTHCPSPSDTHSASQ